MGASERSADRLRVIMFSAMPYEVSAFQQQMSETPGSDALDLVFVSARLDSSTVSVAHGATVVCLFATDQTEGMLDALGRAGVRLIALRYAGASTVDVDRAAQLGISVARAPAHAPTSIAEYTVTLMLALNRKVHVASNRVRDGNLNLHGLVGFDVSDKTVGIIGTGKVGRIVARIMRGFGCRVLAYDMIESPEVIGGGGKYVTMRKLLASSDILSLHAPLVPGTHHMIGAETLPHCKRGVHIINTSRGGLIDVKAVIEALHSGQVGGLAMDVYEGESSLFFRDNAGEIGDLDFHLLKSLPNVLITGHQSALTTNALASVAKSTVNTLMQFQRGDDVEFVIKPSEPAANDG